MNVPSSINRHTYLDHPSADLALVGSDLVEGRLVRVLLIVPTALHTENEPFIINLQDFAFL